MKPLFRLLRYRDLKERRIINSWAQLRDRIDRDGFPPGRKTGPNERTWTEEEISEWYYSRPSDPKPAPPRPKIKARTQEPPTPSPDASIVAAPAVEVRPPPGLKRKARKGLAAVPEPA